MRGAVAVPPAPPDTSNVARLLHAVTASQPTRPAVIGQDGRVRFTYGELTGRAAAIAAGLVARGLAPGGRVALLARDPETALVTAIATLWAGGTLVVPPRAGGWRLGLKAVATSRPTVVVADPLVWLASTIRPELRTAPIRVVTGTRHGLRLTSLDEVAEAGSSRGPIAREAGDPALVTWTTGTTGRPQPVIRSHGVLAAQHQALSRLRGPLPDDVDLVGLATLALHDLACGIALVLLPRRPAGRNPAELRKIAVRTGATMAAGFPTLFERLSEGAAPGALAGLRSIHVGGAPVAPSLIERLATVSPTASVVVVYGSTEVEPIATIEGSELLASVGTPGRGLLVGRVVDGLELKLDPANQGPMSDPEPRRSSPSRGRILVRGPRVARVPSRSDAQGWLDTGDAGSMDQDGRLWLLGRASNGTVDGLFPAEVEEPVAALDEVGAAALVRTSDRGRTQAALVVEPSRPDLASKTVHVRVAMLAAERGWKLDRLVVVRRLPRESTSGKLDYRRLRRMIK